MCDLKDQLNAARDEYDESEKQNRNTEKECDKAQIKLDHCEQRLVQTKENTIASPYSSITRVQKGFLFFNDTAASTLYRIRLLFAPL